MSSLVPPAPDGAGHVRHDPGRPPQAEGEHVDSYYAATAREGGAQEGGAQEGGARRRPVFQGSERVDVAVIGGGLTGLAVALEAAEAGASVAVLEANRIGWGASGRNGGQICSFAPCGDKPFVRDLGRDGAQRVFDMTREAQGRIAARVERYGIACDLRRGYYHGCEGPRQLREAKALGRMFADYGYRGTALLESAEESRRIVDSPAYIGGLLEEEGGHLHPLNYCLGMARAAEGLGVRIYEHSPVLGWQTLAAPAPAPASKASPHAPHAPHGPHAPLQVHAARGDVVADQLVVACNAYQALRIPKLRRAAMPVGSFVVATEPLGRERAEAVLPRDVAVITMKHLGEYFRRTADHRVLLGARANYSGRESVPDFRAAVGKALFRLLPQLEGARLDYAWGGTLAITMRRAPHVGRLAPGVWFAHGYSGAGVLLSQMAAHLIAEAMDGRGEGCELLSRVRAWPFPGGRLLRTPLLVAAGWKMRLEDMRK